MIVPISENDFEEMMERALRPTARGRAPSRQWAVLRLLFEVGDAGASIEEIANHLSQVELEKRKRDRVIADSTPSQLENEIMKLIIEINLKLMKHYSINNPINRSKEITVGVYNYAGLLKFRLERKYILSHMTGMMDYASDTYNAQLLTDEMYNVIRESPTRCDLLGLSAVFGIDDIEFKRMMLNNIETVDNSLYRILLLNPESPLARIAEEAFRAGDPLYVSHLETWNKTISKCAHMRSLISNERNKAKLLVRQYSYNPYWRIRILIKHKSGVHVKYMWPENNSSVLQIYPSDTLIYKVALNAFETIWNHDETTEIPL